MDDLAQRIKAAIENPNGELWFPELTADLAACAWNSLHGIGLTPDSYGTERVLSRNASAPREVITTLETIPCACATTQGISIEALSAESAIKYQEQGVRFYSADEIVHTTILSCLEDALTVMNQVPSLMRTVATLVRSLHIIRPDDDDYDVSFSEPDIPFSIFVSVPERRIPNDALRVAEAIVHEAMHLQLTLIEKTVALAVVSSTEIFSPWRGELRKVHGVLHGLYVFRVIQQFLRATRSVPEPFADNVAYVESRCTEISSQMRILRGFERCSDLTMTGGTLVKI